MTGIEIVIDRHMIVIVMGIVIQNPLMFLM